MRPRAVRQCAYPSSGPAAASPLQWRVFSSATCIVVARGTTRAGGDARPPSEPVSMTRTWRYALIVATAAMSAASFAQEAAQTKAAAPDPARAKQIVTQVCAACHGADGNSVAPANPNLAGQGADYI